MDSSLKKQIDNIASVEDYLKYKEQLDQLDNSQEVPLDPAPPKPKVRASILKQSKMSQRTSFVEQRSSADQTQNYPLYQTMVQSQFDMSRVFKQEEPYKEYLVESRRYREGVESRQEAYTDQPVRQVMQQGADRVLHNLLSDVDSLIKRAVGTG